MVGSLRTLILVVSRRCSFPGAMNCRLAVSRSLVMIVSVVARTVLVTTSAPLRRVKLLMMHWLSFLSFISVVREVAVMIRIAVAWTLVVTRGMVSGTLMCVRTFTLSTFTLWVVLCILLLIFVSLAQAPASIGGTVNRVSVRTVVRPLTLTLGTDVRTASIFRAGTVCLMPLTPAVRKKFSCRRLRASVTGNVTIRVTVTVSRSTLTRRYACMGTLPLLA